MGGAGGYAFTPGGNITASGGAGGNVSGNQVSIAGKSSISQDIYGGYSQGGAAGLINGGIALAGQGGLTQRNTVTLIGDQITIAGAIYGGYSANGDGTVNTDATFTSYYQGNTLNLNGYRGAVTGIYNFENYNWVLPKDVVNKDVLITITGTNAVLLDNTKHTVAMENDGNRLNVGDTVTLIDKATGTPTLTTAQVQQGHFIIYDASLQVGADGLVLSIDGKVDNTSAGRINPTSKAFMEGRASAAASTNQGADMLSDNGIAAARASAGASSPGGMFVSSGGGSSRYKTGSHVDVRDMGLALGAAKSVALQGQSRLLLGAFVELGVGRYDSYNHFADAGVVRGKGDSTHTGVGLMLHLAGLGQASTASGKFAELPGGYLSTVLRVGRSKNTFDSADLTDANGVRGRYTSKATYYSAMLGGGYVWDMDNARSLDVYGRYTWGHLGADSVTIGNDHLEFAASQSARLRVGARWSFAATEKLRPYVGLGVEREFKGAASGSSYGLAIEQPSLKGNTGIVELGLTLLPQVAQQGWEISLGLQGYTGKREGVSAAAKAKYVF